MYNKALYLITLLAVCISANLPAQYCQDALEDALESFGQQRYNLIIALLTDCPPERMLEKTQKIMAYELLAQAYFVNKQVDLIKAALNKLLDLQPDYAPQPPQYSEEFIKMVDAVKDERTQRETRSIFRNKWFWIGGFATTSAVMYLILNKEQRKLLPEAPDPPGS